MRTRLGALLVLFTLTLAGTAGAATPSSGTIDDAHDQIKWTGSLTAALPSPNVPEACLFAECDEFELTLQVGLQDTAPPGGLQVGVRWEDELLDLDLYVYGPYGDLVARSTGFFASKAETVLIEGAVSGTYRVVAAAVYTEGEPMAYEGLAEIERRFSSMPQPVVDLRPNLVPLGARNLRFETAQYLTDFGLPTNSLSSCYPEEIAEQGARRCMRFDQIVANFGDGALELRYRLETAAEDSRLDQRIYRSDGTFSDRKADTYEFHPAHAHFHYKGFAVSRLWASNEAGERLGAAPVKTGKKNGFCMIDVENSWWGRQGDAGRTYMFPSCNVPSTDPDGVGVMVNGISRGWADIYNWYLADQFIEVTGVPDGLYLLETIADPNDTIVETIDDDNLATSLIRITGDSAEFVDAPATRAAPAPQVAVARREGGRQVLRRR